MNDFVAGGMVRLSTIFWIMEFSLMPLSLAFGETITDMELQARVERNSSEVFINAVHIISAAEGYYVKIWLDGLSYYMSTTRQRNSPRYWRRLPSLIEHIQEMHPYIKKISLKLDEAVVHKPMKRAAKNI
jgi:hypothetical protein